MKQKLFLLIIFFSQVVLAQDNIDLNSNSELTSNGQVLPSPNEQKYSQSMLLPSLNNNNISSNINLPINYNQLCQLRPKTKISIQYQIMPATYNYNIKSKDLIKIASNSDVMGLYKGDQDLRVEPILKILQNNRTNQACDYVSDVTVTLIYSPKIYVASEAKQFQCTFNRVLKHENTHYAIESHAIEKLKPALAQMLNQIFDSNLMSSDEPSLEQRVKSNVSLVMYNYKKLFADNTLPYHRQLDNTDNYIKEQHECSDEENQRLTALVNE